MRIIKQIAILIVALVCCGQVHSQVTVQSLPPKEFSEKMEQAGAVIIDVRLPEEFGIEHLKGAININVKSDDFKKKIAELDKTKTYFLYCGTGKRSEIAGDIMKKEGFTKLYSLEGGLVRWKTEGFPVVPGNKAE